MQYLNIFLIVVITMAFAMGTRVAAEGSIPIGSERFLGIETVSLWPDSAPGAKGTTPADVPSITVLRPLFNHINGTAVIVAPGGGYVAVAGNQGRMVADWFTARGVTAFVLNYRLGKRYPLPIALADAQRAIRFVRANAKRWGVIPEKTGMIGFSSGGHLIALAGTSFTGPNAQATDPVDRESDRPDFIILGYPAIALTEIRSNGGSEYCEVAQIPNCDAKAYGSFVPDKLVRADSPPTFLYHTTEDELASPENSLRFYRALLAKKVPVELHIFDRGAHGSTLGNGDPQLDQWPALLEGWLRQRGFLDQPSKPIVVAAAVDEGPLSLQSSLGRLLGDTRATSILEQYIDQSWLRNPAFRALSVATIIGFDLTISDRDVNDLDRKLRSIRR